MATEEPRMVSMSTTTLNEYKTVLEKVVKELEQTKIELSTTKQERDRYAAKVGKRDRQMCGSIIDTMVRDGRMPPVDGETCKNILATKQLSLATGDDREVNAVLAKIEVYKKVPKGTFFTADQRAIELSRAKEVPRHDLAQFNAGVANMTEQQVDALLDETYGAVS